MTHLSEWMDCGRRDCANVYTSGDESVTLEQLCDEWKWNARADFPELSDSDAQICAIWWAAGWRETAQRLAH